MNNSFWKEIHVFFKGRKFMLLLSFLQYFYHQTFQLNSGMSIHSHSLKLNKISLDLSFIFYFTQTPFNLYKNTTLVSFSLA